MLENYEQSKKKQCKQIMSELLGPVSASKVDDMSESDCVEQCKEKIRTLLGDRVAAQFDNIHSV